MELVEVCLLMALLATSHACIPTKTPEQGIPATPGGPSGPKTCPPLTKWTACNVPGFTCSEATLTATSATCANGVLILKGANAGSGYPLPVDTTMLECRGTDWTLVPSGQTFLAWTGANAGQAISTGELACYS